MHIPARQPYDICAYENLDSCFLHSMKSIEAAVSFHGGPVSVTNSSPSFLHISAYGALRGTSWVERSKYEHSALSTALGFGGLSICHWRITMA